MRIVNWAYLWHGIAWLAHALSIKTTIFQTQSRGRLKMGDQRLYHMRVILVCLIFFCSWKIPYIKASDVGGPMKLSEYFVSTSKVTVGKGARTSRDINIDRDDPITSADDRVAVMVVTTTICTTAHADDPAGIGHLIINLSQSRRHLICQSPSHNHHIGLSRRGSENDS